MKEQEISLPTAKLAKLKGFDWECRGYYCPPRKQGNKYTEHYGYFNSNKFQFYIDDKGIKREVEMYSAPTQNLLQSWLRNKKILVEVFPIDSWEGWHYKIYLEDVMSPFYAIPDYFIEYESYEQDLEAGLLEALNLLDDKS